MFCFLLETLDCEVLFLVKPTLLVCKDAKIRRGEDGNADFSDGFANADLNGFFLAGLEECLFLAKSQSRKNITKKFQFLF